jgi:hypothetical protein
MRKNPITKITKVFDDLADNLFGKQAPAIESKVWNRTLIGRHILKKYQRLGIILKWNTF